MSPLQAFHLKRPRPVAALVFLGAALLMSLMGLATWNLHWLIGSILPYFVSAVLWWSRRPSFRVELTLTGLRLRNAPAEIEYAQIIRVHGVGDPTGRRGAAAIRVEHERGVAWIPLPLDIPAVEFVEELRKRFTPREEARVVPDEVRPFYDEQCERFGSDRVWVFTPKPDIPPRYGKRVAPPMSAALALAGLAWVVVAGLGAEEYRMWLVGTVLLFLIAPLWFLAGLVDRRLGERRATKLANAALVVAPSGLALVQGDLQGTLAWEEIQRIECTYPSGLGVFRDFGRHIAITVSGTTIEILDIFHVPIMRIAGLMQRHLAPPRCDEVRTSGRPPHPFPHSSPSGT